LSDLARTEGHDWAPWARGAGGKQKLLLLLSRFSDFSICPIAATLAWLCRSQGWAFDNYYDAFHEGVHFPGGDWRSLELGKLTGGTVCADRHFEEFYHLLLRFDVTVATTGEGVFDPSLKRLKVPIAVDSGKASLIYQKVFGHFGIPVPKTTVMIGANLDVALRGLEAYLAPEVWYRDGLGIHETISDGELNELCEPGSPIVCVCVNDAVLARLRERGYATEVIDTVAENDDYLSVTERLARRWSRAAKGWIVGDPILACHWLPKSCEERLIPVYGVPQQKAIGELADLISAKARVVYGRQYSDHDFFALSRLNRSLQVVDPCRPPFQSVRHLDSTWGSPGSMGGFFAPEYSDEQLREFGRANRVMVSLLFWSGMIRELVNLYPLMDLIATVRLRCGLVLTSESFRYMTHPPLELLTVPLEDGGVHPLVEVVLGSSGEGVAIESVMDGDTLRAGLTEALRVIKRKVGNEKYVPRGWWGTMDADLEGLTGWGRAPLVRISRERPWVRVRVPADDTAAADSTGSRTRSFHRPMRALGRALGLAPYVAPLRPYECFRAGPIKEDVVRAVKSAGLSYMFTKAGFNLPPDVQYLDDQFVALNYTAGQWDGWTPFETVNSIGDLRRAERKVLRSGRPGWIVSTIDTCQWAFGGEFWKRASALMEVSRFCSSGGSSGKLLNVKPYTLARYARILAEAKSGEAARMSPIR
jgi:hypothetical protein